MTQHIGQDFSTSISLSLLPGITLAPGYWQAQISWICHDDRMTHFNNTSFNCGGDMKDFEVIVGRDALSIEFMVYRHNSYPGYPNTYVKYNLRVDHLILLNFVERLVGSTVKI